MLLRYAMSTKILQKYIAICFNITLQIDTWSLGSNASTIQCN